MRLETRGKGAAWLLMLALLFTTQTLLQGCGFHLRGSTGVAVVEGKLFVQGRATEAELMRELRSMVQSAGGQLVATAALAEVLLNIDSSSFSKRVSAVSSSGRAAEYELSFKVNFSVSRGEDVLINNQSLALGRNMQFDESQVLAQSSEEAQLLKEMQREAAQRILRRLQAVTR